MKGELPPFLERAKAVINGVVQKLQEKSYYVAKARFFYSRLRKKAQPTDASPLLVYQPGKVGSTTIVRSLNALDLDMPIYHVHYLSPGRVAEREEKSKKYFKMKLDNTNISASINTPWRYSLLRKQLKRGDYHEKWKLVTLIRDPIARNISSFFQHVSEVIPLESGRGFKLKSASRDWEATVRPDNVDTLKTLFFEKTNHEDLLMFWDNELKDVFGIDVFASEFPKSKGYAIYEGQKARLLLIKLEYLNRCAAEAFKAFLDLDGFALIDANVGQQKPYHKFYQNFKREIKLPLTYIDKMYNSKFMQHFYTQEEIENYRVKWQTQS